MIENKRQSTGIIAILLAILLGFCVGMHQDQKLQFKSTFGLMWPDENSDRASMQLVITGKLSDWQKAIEVARVKVDFARKKVLAFKPNTPADFETKKNLLANIMRQNEDLDRLSKHLQNSRRLAKAAGFDP